MERLRIIVDGGAEMPAEEVDTRTTVLRAELLELGLEAVDRPVTEPPRGAKSGVASTIGMLVATGIFSASTLKAIADVAIEFVRRGGARSVTIENGDSKLELTGASKADVEAVVSQWIEAQERQASA